MDEVIVTDAGLVELVAPQPDVEVIVLDSVDQELVFVGDVGIQGAPGRGIPAGGITGQYYRKASNDDYDGEWSSVAVGDSNFSQEVTGTTLATILHGLGKYPSVTLTTSAGDEVEADVNYIDANQLQVLFAVPFTGKVSCN